jgi:hypothetical protein
MGKRLRLGCQALLSKASMSGLAEAPARFERVLREDALVQPAGRSVRAHIAGRRQDLVVRTGLLSPAAAWLAQAV